MTTAVAPRPTTVMNKEMRLARAAMNDALKPRFAKIEKRHSDLDTQEVLGRHAIGRELMELAGPDSEAKYGDNAIGLVAAGLGVNASELYAYQNIARAWSKEELDILISDARKRGFTLSYTLLSRLSSLEASERKKMTRRCIAEVLTVSDLNRELQALRGHISNSTGRPFKDPRTPHAGIVQLTQLADNVNKREKTFVRGVFDKLEALSEAEWDSQTIKDMEKAKTVLEHSQASLRRLEQQLSATIEKGRHALDARKVRKQKSAEDASNAVPTNTTEELSAKRKKKKATDPGEFTPVAVKKKKKKKNRALATA